MTGLAALWLPILLSAVAVVLVSAFIHMALPWHRDEYPPVPNERGVMDALRPFAIPPGDYMVPRATSMKEMATPEFTQRLTQGPVLVMTVLPNRVFNMGPSLAKWFVYSVVVSIFAAYVAGRALPAGAAYLDVFRFAGVTAFVGYTLALWQMSIWYHRSLTTTVKSTIDGLVYALVTAGVFGWLWPS